MDHACHRCGARVEDGIAFCPRCGAPQIRVAAMPVQAVETQVAAPQPDLPGSAPLPPGTPGEVQPPAQPVNLSAPPWAARPTSLEEARTIVWRQALPAMLASAIMVAVLAGILPLPLLFGLLWALLGGALCVRLYRRRTRRQISAAAGARLGAVTGVISFALVAAVVALQIAALGTGKLRQMLVEAVQQSAARNPDPRAQELVQFMTSAEGLAILVTLSAILFLIAFLAFSTAGGALSASLWGRDER